MDRNPPRGFWGSCKPSLSPPSLPEPQLQTLSGQEMVHLQEYTCTSGGITSQRDPGESCRWTLQVDPVRAGCQSS
eukprot:11644865-Heterocapsa_arctica.AAC.1